ncbi:hypothetical protein J6590_032214 [Homalodisca vitripennis]|nr:hypothetical protein J6590_032214 [Homalodisca vitripennis]
MFCNSKYLYDTLNSCYQYVVSYRSYNYWFVGYFPAHISSVQLQIRSRTPQPPAPVDTTLSTSGDANSQSPHSARVGPENFFTAITVSCALVDQGLELLTWKGLCLAVTNEDVGKIYDVLKKGKEEIKPIYYRACLFTGVGIYVDLSSSDCVMTPPSAAQRQAGDISQLIAMD